jgi:hypothetical protein
MTQLGHATSVPGWSHEGPAYGTAAPDLPARLMSHEGSLGIPLTPTRPGRHDRVQGGSTQFHKPCDQRTNTAAYDYE